MQKPKDLEKLVGDYFKIRQQIFDYFGYEENWVVIPIDNSTMDYKWALDQNEGGGGTVHWIDNNSNEYSNEIYTQRFLNKWVYEGPEFTMVVVDTHTDGNKFLQIFRNSLRDQSLLGGEDDCD